MVKPSLFALSRNKEEIVNGRHEFETLITVVTIIVAGVGILLGSLVPAIVESKAAVKALEGIIRQPKPRLTFVPR
jgi:F0F1-type ATP synthase membrane subunit c/vacuolar-type H+-ATPase subunit K